MARRHAEIIGAGFAGLTAACALAQRGWSVRVRERAPELRAAGAGIYIYENGLRVLQALGAYDEAVRGAPLALTRQVRDERNRIVAVHRWPPPSRVFSIVRQHVINALGSAAKSAGVEIVTGSTVVEASASGELLLEDGRRVEADLVLAADGVNSRIRDGLALLQRRRALADGAIRMLIPRTPDDDTGDAGTTVEYWSGTRRLLYTPCSAHDIYIALTMLHDDEEGKALPVRPETWTRFFPFLSNLIARLDGEARYDRFELIRLRRWSRGRVAVLGDAAHALPPNIGQGGGCAMMNALALAVHLDRADDVPAALAAWERAERPLTEHTQRMSVLLGLPTRWPPALRRGFFALAGRSSWFNRQRMRTALHQPLGTRV